ncbi:hypothetical protein [Agriterribacter sp.]|uniref:hypothetical protein n=1 Tax=Agriterribacter sp. TaxID=2821509 RepID=UPI002C1E6BD0|nr:hypothetical protein [Agriterribacter sp.]HRO46351.1 hypothetical protein [Agriterribacter sp.]HRQ17518.1 hypothetical protein [Agriterribacter sp.]
MQRVAYLNLIWILLWGSCSSNKDEALSKAELIRYINDKKSGLVQAHKVNGINVTLTYQPSSFFVAQEMQTMPVTDSLQKLTLEKKYDNYYYFRLKFSKNGREAIRQLGGFNDYSKMVQVLSFQMNRYVSLITSPQRDTVELSDYLFDQTYGMSDGSNLLLCFDKNKMKESDFFDINIDECGFGTGALKFRIRKSDIAKVPRLDYSKSL